MQGKHALIGLTLAALALAGPARGQVTVAPSDAVSARLLAAQNAERVRLGVAPLAWSAKLADHAKKWAQTLAVSDMFEHAPVGADGGEGENLWTGTRGDYALEEMIGFFIDEGKQFKRGVFPDVSTTGQWQDVGHYTQLVWKDTREVGCALATNAKRDILVCRYWPAGNVIGQPVYDYAAAMKAAGAAAPVTQPPVAASPVSPSKPKKRVSKRRRRGG